MQTCAFKEELAPGGLNYRLYKKQSKANSRNPLVLVMGYGGSLLSWPPAFVELLAKTNDVLIVDNRGTGKSARLERGGDLRIEHFVEDLLALLDYLSWEKVNLLGYSMGGCISLEFANRHPEKLNKLVLLPSTAGGAYYTSSDPDVKERLMNPRGSNFDEMFFDFFELCFSEQSLKNFRPQLQIICDQSRAYPTSPMVLLAQLAAFRNFDASKFANGLKVPALVIHGRGDRLIKTENGLKLAEEIPNAQSLFIDNCGHCPHVEHEEQVYKAIEDFLEQ